MRSSMMPPVVSLLALMIAGCAAPPLNSHLQQARDQFSALQGKPASQTLAALETKDAFNALNKADAASNMDRRDPTIDQLAYLATQKIALAEQTIVVREAEVALKNIAAERTQVQLDVRTQQLKALQAMKAKQSPRGQVVTFGDVLFDTGKADLKYGSQRQFQQLADFLASNPERKVRVEGFTDDIGSVEANQQLSERRAAAVASALVRLGIDRQRLSIKGYGEEFPIADNGNAESRQHNRRVEVIVSNGAAVVGTRN
ncbi:OmpA family protein [Pseudomonas sp. EL_65y_Pfl2_R96]|uniref:OmpA family protein n=1 Tax=Pseudomonas sp. EL_65y_Pfl2_R96 TaxID=3088699 RepID=UPI0030D7509E